MPGFGYGPFGQGPFGDWNWEKVVLYDYIPQIYRQFDPDNDYLLEKYAAGLASTFNELRTKIRNFPDLRNPLKVRTQYDEVVTLTLGRRIVPQGELQQRGLDGAISSIYRFSSPTARFRFDDRDKNLVLSNSTFAKNNQTFSISKVIDTKTVELFPLPQNGDPGPLTWELRPKVEVPDNEMVIEVQGGEIGEVKPGWILEDGNGEFLVLARQRFDWTDPTPLAFAAATGVEAKVVSGTPNEVLITDDVAPLIPSMVGQQLVLVGGVGSQPEATGVFEILTISTGGPPWTLTVDPEPPVDATEHYWAIRPQATLTLQGRETPRGVVEQQGVEGTVGAAGVFTTQEGVFTDGDLPPPPPPPPPISIKTLTIRGSSAIPSNDGEYAVTALGPTFRDLIVSPVFPSPAEVAPLTWELRGQTDFSGPVTSTVSAHNTSLLAFLAEDFGIANDTAQPEDRQRAWVQWVSAWINRKGIEKAYEIVGDLTGQPGISVQALWHVSQDIFEDLAPSDVHMEPDMSPGKFGARGYLYEVAGHVRLTDANALWVHTDINRSINVTDAADNANEKLYEIESVVDPTTVEFRVQDQGVNLPDYGPGGTLGNPLVSWETVRLYALQPQSRPRYDDFDSDLMDQIINSRYTNQGYLHLVAPFPTYKIEAIGEHFVPTDIGLQVLVENSGQVPTNDGFYTIKSPLPATTDEADVIEAWPGAVPDPNDGSITITVIGGLLNPPFGYTPPPPYTPPFSVDRLCWEAGFTTKIPFEFVSADSDGSGRWRVTVRTPVGQVGSANAIKRAGPWSFWDAVGTQFFVDDWPVGAAVPVVSAPVFPDPIGVDATDVPYVPGTKGVYVFYAESLNPPTIVGPEDTFFEYVCPEEINCDYCRASAILVSGATGIGDDSLIERRIETAAPIHVEVFYKPFTFLAAPLNLTATVEPP